jgi:peptidoglycan/LPS O-acetylase OafA/YrhL
MPIHLLRSTRDVLSNLALSISNGEVAVHIFFVLSGLVLFLSLKRKSSSISPVMLSIQFAVARLMRLYPAVIVCMAGFYGVSVVLRKIGLSGFPVFQFRSFLENASLFEISMHGPSTTVQVEVLAIPFVLAAYFVTRACALPGAILCFVYSIYATDGGWWVLFMPNMHGYLLSFMAGIIVADDSIGAAFAKAPPGIWWGVIIVLLAGRAILPPGIPSLVSMTLTSALLVGGLYHGQPGSLSRLLSSGPAHL